jgi:hypothetical protein
MENGQQAEEELSVKELEAQHYPQLHENNLNQL